MRKYTIDELNFQAENEPQTLVENAEKNYATSLEQLAQTICANSKAKPIVLISGASGASKTTTALRLAQNIEKLGHRAHTLSMDDYFLSKIECQTVFSGAEIDYESPLCVDKALFSEHAQKIAKHETIEIPKFDFPTQSRKTSGRVLECNSGDIVIIEGIHGLNPYLTADLDEVAVKIYVELQGCVVDSEIEICPDKLRLLRRIMRDSKFRGHTVSRTVEYFNRVSQGERKFILPYVDKSDYKLNTFLPYELNLYRNDLLELFNGLADGYCALWGLDSIKQILQKMRFLPLAYTPQDSLVREFVGESSLDY